MSNFLITLRRWLDDDGEQQRAGWTYSDVRAEGLDWEDAVNRVLVRPEHQRYSLWLVREVSNDDGKELA